MFLGNRVGNGRSLDGRIGGVLEGGLEELEEYEELEEDGELG
jgi:hypothetical protein